MLGPIASIMILTVLFAVEGNRRKRDQYLIDDQDDVGPLVTNDKSLTMIKPLRVFWVQAGTILERTINQDGDVEGKPFDLLKGSRQAFSLLFREAFQGIYRRILMKFQHLRELRLMKPAKPSGFLKGVFRRSDHQEKQVRGTNSFETRADPDATCNREHSAILTLPVTAANAA